MLFGIIRGKNICCRDVFFTFYHVICIIKFLRCESMWLLKHNFRHVKLLHKQTVYKVKVSSVCRFCCWCYGCTTHVNNCWCQTCKQICIFYYYCAEVWHWTELRKVLHTTWSQTCPDSQTPGSGLMQLLRYTPISCSGTQPLAAQVHNH